MVRERVEEMTDYVECMHVWNVGRVFFSWACRYYTTQCYTNIKATFSSPVDLLPISWNNFVIEFSLSFLLDAGTDVGKTPAASGEKTVPPPCIVDPLALLFQRKPPAAIRQARKPGASQASR